MRNSSPIRLEAPSIEAADQIRRREPTPRSAMTRSIFVTERSDLAQYNLVKDLHGQLNGLIDQLSDKVEGVINKHDCEFLAAYRAHVKKMRKELDEYRVSSMELKASGERKHIELLEKESVVLREDMARVFQKLEAKSMEVERLKLRLDESEKENKFMQGELKRLMLRTKAQAMSKTPQPPDESISTTLPARPLSKRGMPSIPLNITDRSKKSRHSRNLSESLSERETSLKKQLRTVPGIDRLLEQRVVAAVQPLLDRRDSKYRELRDKYYMQVKQTQRTIQNTTVRSELESFFLQCVDDVRRDLYQKMRRTINEPYNESCMNFELFKKQDRQAILQKFIESDQTVKAVFDAVFLHKPITPPFESGTEPKQPQNVGLYLRRSLNYKSERL